MTDHIETRRKLRSICDVKEFEQIIQNAILEPVEIEILRHHYLRHQDLRFIADTLGYSEQSIKDKHRRAIKKIGQLL
jgi:hypothetical protein